MELPGRVAQEVLFYKAVSCAVCFLGHLYRHTFVWPFVVVFYQFVAEFDSKVGRHDESWVVASVADYLASHIVVECGDKPGTDYLVASCHCLVDHVLPS